MGVKAIFLSVRAAVIIALLFVITLLNQSIALQSESNIEYIYDEFGRLRSVKYLESEVTYTFGFDKSGNRQLHQVAGPGALLRLSDARILEGGVLSFVVNVTQSGIQGVTFDWEVYTPGAPGLYPATPGIDFSVSPSTVTLPVGAQSATITVPTSQDGAVEPPEEVYVRLTSSTIVSIDPNYAEAVGVIRDDDGVYFNVSNPQTVSEGGFIDLVITRQGLPLSAPLDVVVTPVDFEAIAGVDVETTVYSTSGQALPNNTVTFQTSDTSKTVRIQTVSDVNYEADERSNVDLTWTHAGTPGWERADFVIPNDDPLPTIKISNGGNKEGWNVVPTIWTTGDSYLPITVTMAVSDTSATNTEGYQSATMDVDYKLSNAFITNKPAGSLQVNGTQLTYVIPGDENGFLIEFPTEDDTDLEPFEAFYVKLVSATVTLPDGSTGNLPIDPVQFEGRGRIRDDDSPVTMSIGGAPTAQEGTTLSFPVSLSSPAYDVTTANWSIVSGGAGDYTTSSGTIEIQPNEDSATINIPLNENDQDQPNRVITVALSLPVNATLGTSSAAGQVNDNDGAPVINIFNVWHAEGNASNTMPIVIFLQGGTTMPVTVTYQTTDGTATAGQDYVAIPPTTVTIAPSGGFEREFEYTFDVTVLGDSIVEGDETFNIEVVSAVNATTVTSNVNPSNPTKGSNGVGTIANDDVAQTQVFSYSGWSGWQGACGGTQTRTRTRYCTWSPSGTSCGSTVETDSRVCNIQTYSTGPWSGWQGACGGTQTRTRTTTCTWSPSGASCGSTTETGTRVCNIKTYSDGPVSWGTCSAGGTQSGTYTRTCTWSPSGSSCGSTTHSTSRSCTPPVTYTYSWSATSWSAWQCSGTGTIEERSGTRSCIRSPGGASVAGSFCGGSTGLYQTRNINNPACGGSGGF